MLYFTTDVEELRTANRKLTTGLCVLLFRGGTKVSQKLLEPIHSRAWMRLASVLKSETPCNS
jgi:hypothetical protein